MWKLWNHWILKIHFLTDLARTNIIYWNTYPKSSVSFQILKNYILNIFQHGRETESEKHKKLIFLLLVFIFSAPSTICFYMCLLNTDKIKRSFNGLVRFAVGFITNTTCNGICCRHPPVRINQVQLSQNTSKTSIQLLSHILCTVKVSMTKISLDDYSCVGFFITLLTLLMFLYSTPPNRKPIHKQVTTKSVVSMSFLWSRLKPFWCKSFWANC